MLLGAMLDWRNLPSCEVVVRSSLAQFRCGHPDLEIVLALSYRIKIEILTSLAQLFLPGTPAFELCPSPASLEALMELPAAELAVNDLTFRCCIPAGSQALKDTRRGLLESRISLTVVAVEMLLGLKSLSLGAYSEAPLPSREGVDCCATRPRRCGGRTLLGPGLAAGAEVDEAKRPLRMEETSSREGSISPKPRDARPVIGA